MKVKDCRKVHHHGGGAIYGLGFIGAVVYYLQQATSLWEGIVGLAKAVVWPAIMVHKLLSFLYM